MELYISTHILLSDKSVQPFFANNWDEAGATATAPPFPVSAASEGSKNVIPKGKHIILDVVCVHSSQEVRKPTFQKWVLHDLTNMKDTHWMAFYVYILGYSASF